MLRQRKRVTLYILLVMFGIAITIPYRALRSFVIKAQVDSDNVSSNDHRKQITGLMMRPFPVLHLSDNHASLSQKITDFSNRKKKPDKISEQNLNLPAKVIIAAYFRSGSTFAGELFNSNPEAFYLFEPLRSIFGDMYLYFGVLHPSDLYYVNDTKRNVPEFEQEMIASSLKSILNCEMEALPFHFYSDALRHKLNILSSSSFRSCMRPYINQNCQDGVNDICVSFRDQSLQKCHENIETINQMDVIKPDILNSKVYGPFAKHNVCVTNTRKIIQPCIEKLKLSCSSSKIRSLKTIRLPMDNVRLLLQKDSSIKIIHLIRDPRGTLLSRMKWDGLTYKTRWIHAAKVTCSNILDDIEARQKIEKEFVNNFLTIRYEDLASHPMEVTKLIYNHLNRPLPERVSRWVREITHAKHNNGDFGTRRRDSATEAYDWRTNLSDEKKNLVLQNSVCRKLIRLMEYPEN